MAALSFSGITISSGVQFSWPPQNPPTIGTATATGTTTATVSYTAPAGSVIEGTPYSVSFTGVSTGSKLTIPHSTELQVSSSDFTVEAWIYVASWPSTGDHNYVIFQKGLNTSSTYEWGFSLYRGNGFGNSFAFGLGYSTNGSTISTATAGSNLMTTGNWYHVAVSRNSGTAKVYYDGVLAFSIALSTNNYTGSAYVGYGYSSSGQNDSFNGYISNLRLVVGTGLYPSAFTPPTASLTAITNTKLLTCQSSTIIDNSINNFTITATSATVSATAPSITGPLQSEIVSYTAVSNPSGGSGTLVQATSGTIPVTGLTQATNYTFTVYASSTVGSSPSSAPSNQITTDTLIAGQVAYTTPGTYTWTAPAGVTSVSVVAVGGGGSGLKAAPGAGGTGGGLGYKNNITVVPGNSYTVVVGAGGASSALTTTYPGGDSYFINTTIVKGGGGLGATQQGTAGGSYTGDGGGNGGSVSTNTATVAGGGGGAGGYTGSGGIGGGSTSGTAPAAGGAGNGGGAGGGSTGLYIAAYGARTPGAGGGGTGLLGQGTSGAGTSYPSGGVVTGGNAGSGGNNGSGYTFVTGSEVTNLPGGSPGGGGGGVENGGSYVSGKGGDGAVRIIWPGDTRQFPSTNTADV